MEKIPKNIQKKRLGLEGISNENIVALRRVFKGMRQRCYQQSSNKYVDYGARGVTICDEWLETRSKFIRFAADNGWKKGLHTDRIDPTKGYSPDNVRFVTPLENNRNTGATVFSEDLVKKMLDLYCIQKLSKFAVAREVDISPTNIHHVLIKRTWVDITEQWEKDNNVTVEIRKKTPPILTPQQALKQVFRNIRQRCRNPNATAYASYGGRGIGIHQEWLDDPKKFIQYALDTGWTTGCKINRIDNNGNYEPDNINFICQHENMQNTSATKLSPELIYEMLDMYHNDNVSVAALSKQYDIGRSVIRNMILRKTWTNVTDKWYEDNQMSDFKGYH